MGSEAERKDGNVTVQSQFAQKRNPRRWGGVRHSLLVAEEKRSQRSAQAGARSKVIGIAVSADVLLPQYLLPLSDNSKKNRYWLPLLYFPIFYSLSEMSGTIDMKRLPQSQRKKEKDRSSKLKKQAVCLRASLVKDNSPSKPGYIYVVSTFLSQNFVIRWTRKQVHTCNNMQKWINRTFVIKQVSGVTHQTKLVALGLQSTLIFCPDVQEMLWIFVFIANICLYLNNS